MNLPHVLSPHEEATVRCAKARPGSNSSSGSQAPVRPKTSGPHASTQHTANASVFINRCGAGRHVELIPSDYVYREAKRALEGVAGTRTLIWPGIDIDIPTDPNNSKCTPQSVKEVVLAALRAGAPGVLLSRKYSEMRLANLSGAGEAIRELKLSG